MHLDNDCYSNHYEIQTCILFSHGLTHSRRYGYMRAGLHTSATVPKLLNKSALQLLMVLVYEYSSHCCGYDK